MAFYRTVALGDTVYFPFAVNSVAGSGTDGASAVASVRQCGTGASVAPVITAAGTNLSHASFPNGAWETGIAVTSGNGFAVGNEYSVFATIAFGATDALVLCVSPFRSPPSRSISKRPRPSSPWCN